MEKIQGQTKLSSLYQNVKVRRSLEVQESVDDQSFVIEEEQSLQDTTIPFLQMLQQSEDPCSFLSFKDQNLLALVSHEVPECHPETNHYYQNPSLEGVNDFISCQELPLKPLDKGKNKRMATSVTREKRKRRRTKPTKNIEEMESQRMTHIAVERNRRRQMNIHLNSLRSLIPSHYIQRGDQASIVGGAIDFIKILEQNLQSLEAQKNISSNRMHATIEEQTSKLKIDTTVIESHVSLRIQCVREQGQLVKSITLLEKLRFTVLHLNITSPSKTVVSYSFNLKMEDDCSLGSADEITTAIRQIFECRLLD